MSDMVSGIAALAVLALLVIAPVALILHRRPPEEVVTTGSVRGQAGMAVHPWRGHRATTPMSWLLAAGVTALGLYYVGRSGDGTVTLTPEGLHQLHAGSEVFVPWDVVRGLVTTPTDLIVETTRPVVPVHHMLPWLERRSVVTEDAISLPRRNLPPLPYQEMVELYSTSPAARDELATEEPVRRARGMLSAIPT